MTLDSIGNSWDVYPYRSGVTAKMILNQPGLSHPNMLPGTRYSLLWSRGINFRKSTFFLLQKINVIGIWSDLHLLEHSVKQLHLSFGILADQELTKGRYGISDMFHFSGQPGQTLPEVSPAEETSLCSQNFHVHPLQSLLHRQESLSQPWERKYDPRMWNMENGDWFHARSLTTSEGLSESRLYPANLGPQASLQWPLNIFKKHLLAHL